MPFEIQDDIDLFAKIMEAFTPEVPIIGCENHNEITPVFVVGMPRSGTTLVEQILASHDEVHTAGELLLMNQCVDKIAPPFTYENLKRLRDEYLDGIQDISGGKQFVIDKLPLNFKWLGFIICAIPEAKIIYCKRDPRAVCFSNFTHSFEGVGNQFAYGLEDVAHFYNLHMELMTFWNTRFPGVIHEQNYEHLTEDQEEETIKLLNYLGVPWDDKCVDFYNNGLTVETASHEQVKQPMYQNSSNAWKAYESRLKPMLKILKNVNYGLSTGGQKWTAQST